MKHLIRKIAAFLGIRTTYHVAAMYTHKILKSSCNGAMTVTVTPWIHVNNYSDIVIFVQSSFDGCEDKPTITSITKLGI